MRKLTFLPISLALLAPIAWLAIATPSFPDPAMPAAFDFTGSLLRSIALCAGACLIAIPCAFSLAQLHFTGRSAALLVFLLVAIAPPAALAAGSATMAAQLAVTVAIATWLLYPTMAELPTSIADAATLDGMKIPDILSHLIVPAARPALPAVVAIVFLFAWSASLLHATAAHELTANPKGLALACAPAIVLGAASARHIATHLHFAFCFLLRGRSPDRCRP